MVEKYRPSNGTEGDAFMARFCARCTKDSEANPCPIIFGTMAFDTEDDEYPAEWVEDEGGPRCTAFDPKPEVRRGS